MSEIFGMIDIEAIEKLADIVSSKELSELTLADGEKTITLKGRKVSFEPAPAKVLHEIGSSEEIAVSDNKEIQSGNIVKCPIVGTFYSAPSPEKPPFVSVGDRVSKGDVIMIIESMKLMNEIQSEFDGVIEEILVSNGQAVEYDQPLMVIK